MFKKIVCLFFLLLGAGCAAKAHLATPEDLLKEMAGHWEVDIEASRKVYSSVQEEILSNGEESFVKNYGQLGVGINVQTREFFFYKSRGVLISSWPFVVAPETPEDKAAREKGIRQVRLILDNDTNFAHVLRYEADGKLSVFDRNALIGVFSRLKE